MMTKTQNQAAEDQAPLLLSFAIALPVLDAIAWVGSRLVQAPNAPAAPGALIHVTMVSLLLGLLFCILSLVRRESLRALGFICLIGYLVPIALMISHAH